MIRELDTAYHKPRISAAMQRDMPVKFRACGIALIERVFRKPPCVVVIVFGRYGAHRVEDREGIKLGGFGGCVQKAVFFRGMHTYWQWCRAV